ncbi:MAG: hypothetical protein GX605_07520, partial [Chloroflexi bacterium]|nr:hypothetical protein [Chloroflexota bacterium]
MSIAVDVMTMERRPGRRGRAGRQGQPSFGSALADLEADVDPGGEGDEDAQLPLADGEPSDPIQLYLQEIGQVPLLSVAEERELAAAIQVGREAAQQLEAGLDSPPAARQELTIVVGQGKWAERQLAQANLRLVVSVAKHFLGRGISLPDLIQEGNLGLLHAVQKFDPQRGYKFST